jgi:hypothetical protein
VRRQKVKKKDVILKDTLIEKLKLTDEIVDLIFNYGVQAGIRIVRDMLSEKEKLSGAQKSD